MAFWPNENLKAHSLGLGQGCVCPCRVSAAGCRYSAGCACGAACARAFGYYPFADQAPCLVCSFGVAVLCVVSNPGFLRLGSSGATRLLSEKNCSALGWKGTCRAVLRRPPHRNRRPVLCHDRQLAAFVHGPASVRPACCAHTSPKSTPRHFRCHVPAPHRPDNYRKHWSTTKIATNNGCNLPCTTLGDPRTMRNLSRRMAGRNGYMQMPTDWSNITQGCIPNTSQTCT